MSWLNGSTTSNDSFLDVKQSINDNNMNIDEAIKEARRYNGDNFIHQTILKNEWDISLFSSFELYIGVVYSFMKEDKQVQKGHVERAYQRIHTLLTDERYLSSFSKDFAQERKEALIQEQSYLKLFL